MLNLGTVKASKLYIEGRNVTVLSTDAVTDADGQALKNANVTIRSTETPHIGYDVGDKTAPSTTASDYANANTAKSATGRGWDVKKLGGGAAHTDYDYMCVHDVYDLQNIHAKLDGRYMLARDIDASATATWDGGKGFAPIGNNSNRFTGRFDGVRHTIRGLQIKRPNERYVGLFGTAKNARIENVSLVDGNVKGDQRVGGIVGTMENSTVQNASNAGQVKGWMNIGGIVGAMSNGTIQNASNVGAVAGSFGGGIVGAVTVGTVRNVWNAGQVTGDQQVGGIAGKMSAGKVIQAVWKTGTAAHAVDPDNNTGFEEDCHEHTEADMKLAATYTSWQDEHGKALVATEGGKGTPWRIYNGHTMPLLTALMKGTKRLEKTYDGKTFGDGDTHILSDTPLEKNVGTRDASGIYSDTFGYDLIGSTYRIAPRVLTMSGVASQTKTYDGNTNADATQFSATLNNVVTGEESLVTATATGAAYNSKDVATANKVNYALALSGTGAGNYTLAATTVQGAGTISRRALTLGTVAAQTKTYDGTTAADAGKFRAALTNAIAGDSVAATATGAAYNSKDVAGANTVNYTGVALGGADAGNYSLDAVAQGTGTITRRALTFDAVAAQTKTYDGNTNADAAQFSATLGNIVAGEENSVSATAAGATYNDKNVAGANKVSYTGVALGGTGAGNYSIADTAQGKGTITKRALTLGTVTAQTKIYDGTTAADAGKFSAALTNAIAGDSVAATATGAAYNSKNVAAASTIGYTGVALSGADAGNYSLAATTAQGAGTITARELTLGTVASQSKTYDGTRAADASKFSAALNNAVAGDNVTAAAAGATYNDHNVAAARTIDYTGVSLGGSDAGNYSLAATAAQGEGRITPKELNLALTGGARFDKTYDGTANVAQSLTKGTNYNLNGFVTGEGAGIELSAVTGKYADKNAAADKAVTFDGLTLTGTGAGNYTLNKTALTGTGTIAKRALTLGAVAAQTKTYDGTTAADTAKFSAGLNNVVAGDNVMAAATGATYNDKNVARANRIDYTGIALRGADAGNYSIANTAQGAGTITHRELTLTAAPHSIVQGEPLPSFTGRADGFADGEDASVFGTDGLTFESTVKNTETPGSYGVTGRIGGVTDGVLGNYRIRQATGNATAFTIHAAALPGGLLASLVQDAAPRFDFGFGDTVYLYGTARPIRAATLGLYRFDAEENIEIQGLRL
ncbi:YDG domain-containing protein [Selenomonas sputigena]|uniref:YDG domain-containing protein n=1 Tax=Selenomonas sputigena TaxID=69823 RepID=UPI0028EA94DE|nr:YDG domain-containing protein [Selenomonas sputigena]